MIHIVYLRSVTYAFVASRRLRSTTKIELDLFKQLKNLNSIY